MITTRKEKRMWRETHCFSVIKHILKAEVKAEKLIKKVLAPWVSHQAHDLGSPLLKNLKGNNVNNKTQTQLNHLLPL